MCCSRLLLLQAVTKAQLGYNPIEVDLEDMTSFSPEEPQTMDSYSVADAVANQHNACATLAQFAMMWWISRR